MSCREVAGQGGSRRWSCVGPAGVVAGQVVGVGGGSRRLSAQGGGQAVGAVRMGGKLRVIR